MGMPLDIKIVDCMLGIPEAEDRSDWFASFRPLIKDAETLDWLRERSAKAEITMSVCNGASVLAAAGLLDPRVGRRGRHRSWLVAARSVLGTFYPPIRCTN